MRIKDTEFSISGVGLFLVLFLCLGAGLALLMAGQQRQWRESLPSAPAPVVSSLPAACPSSCADGFAKVAHKALPAVVNIASAKVIPGEGGGQPLFFRDPFFRQFFGNLFRESPGMPSERRERSRGSGVIVRPTGIVLTNSHMVEGASDVRIALGDKRQFVAKVVGSDPKTDIAVLKIDASDLPTLPLGDSSKLDIGNFVLAIGDPFGIGQTVTMGIVSAVGRGHLDIEDYEDFIQTDAAINPGNSGGALVDVYGNLVGINTAILASFGGGNQGIGFAVPSNLAAYVLDEILRHGKVVRGYLGVRLQDITPAMAKAFGASSASGALVSEVEHGGPADQAGVERGDIIVKMDGVPVADANVLRLRVSQLRPGAVVHLVVLRNGHERAIEVKLADMPSKPPTAAQGAPAPGEQATGILSGMEVGQLTPAISQELGVPQNTTGIVVITVRPGSAVAEAGLRRGDIIHELNRQPIRNLTDFERAAKAAGDSALLLVGRGSMTLYVTIER